MEPKPGDRYCPDCGSYQIVEHTRVDGKLKTVYLHCNMCRRDLDIFTGTAMQVKVFKKRRRLAQKRR